MKIEQVALDLINLSTQKQFTPFDRLDYPHELDSTKLQFPEEYISVFHHPIYKELSDEQKWKLSLLENVNFFSITIHGERFLVKEMESRIYRNRRLGEDHISSEYIQWFIHEENSHTYMMAKYCTKYSGKVYPDYSLNVQKIKLSPMCTDLLFYSQTYILETFLGYINEIASAIKTLDPTSKKIHDLHLKDERRHIRWDKTLIEANLEKINEKNMTEELEIISKAIKEFLDYTISKLYNPAVYKEVGLPYDFKFIKELSENDSRKNTMNKWLNATNKYFSKRGIFK